MQISIYPFRFYSERTNQVSSFNSRKIPVTKQQIETLKAKGYSDAKICEKLDIAISTLYKKMKLFGIARKKDIYNANLAKITKEQIETLLKEKLSIEEICKRLKITTTAYYTLIQKFNIINPRTALKKVKDNISKEQLKADIQSGLTVQEIINKNNITRNIYYNLIKKYNIKTPQKTAQEKNASIPKEKIEKLIVEGKKRSEICKILGISQSSLVKLLYFYGFEVIGAEQRKNNALVTKEVLENLVNIGMPVKEICEKLKITAKTYVRLLNKFGIITQRKREKMAIAAVTKENLQNLVDKGYTVAEICRILNISQSAFYSLLKILEINYNYKHHNNEVVVPTEVLDELAHSNKTSEEISNELGISKTSYYKKVKQQKVETILRESLNKIASIDKIAFQSFVDAGYTIQEVCKHFNIKPELYPIIINTYNIKTNLKEKYENTSKISKELLLSLINQIPVKEICKILNISESTFSNLCNKFGIKTLQQKNIDYYNTITKEILEEKIKAKKNVNEICKELKISRKVYYNLVKKFNISSKRKAYVENIKTITATQILEMRQAGMKIEEICKKLNIAESSYYRILKREENKNLNL